MGNKHDSLTQTSIVQPLLASLYTQPRNENILIITSLLIICSLNRYNMDESYTIVLKSKHIK